MGKPRRVYKTMLHRISALGDAWGRPWTKGAGKGELSRRQYKSYEDYVRHQRAKLGKLDLTEYDQRFAEALQARLSLLPLPWEARSVLCLAARTGAECKAFIALGCFAVGIDLNPGSANRHVVTGDFHHLQFADHSIDYVYTNSLDHALDLERIAAEVKRVLKPSGYLIVEVARGAAEEGGIRGGLYESMWWERSSDVLNALCGAGYRLGATTSITHPFNGVQALLRPLESQQAHGVLFEADEPFHRAYEAGVLRTGTPDTSLSRRRRFYALTQALEAVSRLEGWVAECGCWKGLSSYLMCEYLRARRPDFRGAGVMVIDSFEGLSQPGQHDVIDREMVVKGISRKGRPFKTTGAYTASIEHVRGVLADYPEVEFSKGWIPAVLQALPERTYRLVHVDVDLYEPTLGALRYFYPRMARGGVLICDDYGSLFFPGAKKAVDTFCSETRAALIRSASGEAVLVKV